jgi:hypothetical protein
MKKEEKGNTNPVSAVLGPAAPAITYKY